jgi:hypothetical protein
MFSPTHAPPTADAADRGALRCDRDAITSARAQSLDLVGQRSETIGPILHQPNQRLRPRR